MKTTFKLRLENIIGVVAKAVPEVATKLEGLDKTLGDSIVLEGSAEYSISEVAGVMRLLPEAVDILADTFRKVLVYEKEFDHTEKVEDDTTLQLRSAINSNNEYIKINNRLAQKLDDKEAELNHAYELVKDANVEIAMLKREIKKTID